MVRLITSSSAISFGAAHLFSKHGCLVEIFWIKCTHWWRETFDQNMYFLENQEKIGSHRVIDTTIIAQFNSSRFELLPVSICEKPTNLHQLGSSPHLEEAKMRPDMVSLSSSGQSLHFFSRPTSGQSSAELDQSWPAHLQLEYGQFQANSNQIRCMQNSQSLARSDLVTQAVAGARPNPAVLQQNMADLLHFLLKKKKINLEDNFTIIIKKNFGN